MHFPRTYTSQQLSLGVPIALLAFVSRVPFWLPRDSTHRQDAFRPFVPRRVQLNNTPLRFNTTKPPRRCTSYGSILVGFQPGGGVGIRIVHETLGACTTRAGVVLNSVDRASSSGWLTAGDSFPTAVLKGAPGLLASAGLSTFDGCALWVMGPKRSSHSLISSRFHWSMDPISWSFETPSSPM